MELAESPLCGLCKFYPETISHRFFECKVSSQLWKEIQGEFYLYLVLPSLDIKLILFGNLYDQDQQKVKSHIILIFEKFMYENKDRPDKVKVHAFKNRLKELFKLNTVLPKKNTII